MFKLRAKPYLPVPHSGSQEIIEHLLELCLLLVSELVSNPLFLVTVQFLPCPVVQHSDQEADEDVLQWNYNL